MNQNQNFCSNCGNKISEGAPFCGGCGNKLNNIVQNAKVDEVKTVKVNTVQSEQLTGFKKDIKFQVDNYESLPITKSFRGRLFIVIILFSTIGFLSSFVSDVGSIGSSFIKYILFITLAYFILKGRRWANIVLIIYVALGMGYAMLGRTYISSYDYWRSLGNAVVPILYTVFIYMTLKVENLRKK